MHPEAVSTDQRQPFDNFPLHPYLAVMFGTQNYSLFVLSAILLYITPGQDTLYIVGRSIAQGRRAGLLSVLGISTGTVVHTLAAAFGLSALFAASASAIIAVKFVGAAYLIYLGVRMWFDSSEGSQGPARLPQSNDWEIYRAGLLTNVFNPKVALFNFAFLPQFVDPFADSAFVAFLFLGTSCLVIATIWCVILAVAAAGIGARLRNSTSTSAIIKRTTGALFVGLGAKLAVSK
jgi:threonine/homoserine/homoserine lactone efflux protein